MQLCWLRHPAESFFCFGTPPFYAASFSVLGECEQGRGNRPPLLAGYLVDHELAIAIAKANYDDSFGRSAFSLFQSSRGHHRLIVYSMLRNSPSGPKIGVPGRILAGHLPGKHRNRSLGRPEGRFPWFPGSSPAKIRPGRPIYGPEALLRNIE